ncbi:MAG TPA: NAD-dependent epimerase/dehydratase family protein [Bacteroidota bacterium]
MTQRSALLVGASGLVGGNCLDVLLQTEEYERVVILTRRPLLLEHPKLEEHVVDFDRLDDAAPLMNADDVFCCLGTTIRAAGSQSEFKKVDFTYTVQVGAIAVRNGADQLLVVTSLGANPKSKIFYNRIKGETEEALAKLPCESIHFFRHSLLLGNRKESRRGEKAGIAAMRAFSLLMAGPLKNYRPIEANVVARAMVLTALSNQSGVIIHESDQIRSISAAAVRHL